MKQRFTSKQTSINSIKAPAVYSMKRAVNVMTGKTVVDIGGGTSDIAVISLKGVVESASIKVAGDQFNEAIVKYMRRKHNILIGERTAERLKIEMTNLYDPRADVTAWVKGRNLVSGLPEMQEVSELEIFGTSFGDWYWMPVRA